ncbi:uncharacterized protein LOC134184309 isoform X2 [Corticium candelabrum]|uniref:uncharacterized protein LOC134184309 isoform X2 n=1 Tax=Corticium candelabrum TaxID=121492 RepID=UPI002E339AE1|nr:uncharacterized protein LOC134184309 isoform X2 [Corticium candelabrum]
MWLTQRSESYFIGDKVVFLDRRLLCICPPIVINRSPHTMKEFCTWKEYFVHYSLLVIGCRLLCQSYVSREQMEEARKLLLKFYQIYKLLYGTKAVKVHLLQHLPDVVEKWGALWGHSYFWYESLGGVLKRFVHGTRFVCSQVASIVMIINTISDVLPSLTDQLLAPPVVCLATKFGLMWSPFEVKDSVKAFCLPNLFVDPINVVLRRLGNEELCCGSPVKTVGRLKLAGHVIQSKKSHATKKNSYNVKFTECHEEQPLFGYVLLFIIFGCERFAVIQWLN